jgi:hypothetical protein
MIEENALGTERFEAMAIDRPVILNCSLLYPDDFVLVISLSSPTETLLSLSSLPFRVRWMLNRHSNARLMHPVSILDADVEYDEISTLDCDNSNAGPAPESQPDSVPGSEADSDSEPV